MILLYTVLKVVAINCNMKIWHRHIPIANTVSHNINCTHKQPKNFRISITSILNTLSININLKKYECNEPFTLTGKQFQMFGAPQKWFSILFPFKNNEVLKGSGYVSRFSESVWPGSMLSVYIQLSQRRTNFMCLLFCGHQQKQAC